MLRHARSPNEKRTFWRVAPIPVVFLLLTLSLPSEAQTMLPAPANVAVESNLGSLDVSWDPVDGATDYDLEYRIVAVSTAQVPPSVSSPQIMGGGAGASISDFPWQVALLFCTLRT